jgi:hypothetical protein
MVLWTRSAMGYYLRQVTFEGWRAEELVLLKASALACVLAILASASSRVSRGRKSTKVLVVLVLIALYLLIAYAWTDEAANANVAALVDKYAQNDAEPLELCSPACLRGAQVGALYRLGDLIYYNSVRHHAHFYPGTLAAAFENAGSELSRASIPARVQALSDIVGDVPEEKDVLAMHLRVGDVLDGIPLKAALSGARRPHARRINRFAPLRQPHSATGPLGMGDILARVALFPYSARVLLVVGSHIPLDTLPSTRYTLSVASMLRDRFSQVEIISGREPDDDLRLCISAEYFCKSVGNFSALIADLRTLRHRKSVP